jgi:hypothetical protein
MTMTMRGTLTALCMVSIPATAVGGYYISELNDFQVGGANLALEADNHVNDASTGFWGYTNANGLDWDDNHYNNNDSISNVAPSFGIVGGHKRGGTNPRMLTGRYTTSYRDRSTTACFTGEVQRRRYRATSVAST